MIFNTLLVKEQAAHRVCGKRNHPTATSKPINSRKNTFELQPQNHCNLTLQALKTPNKPTTAQTEHFHYS